MQVIFELLENGVIPEKQTHGSAGYDLYASHDAIIEPSKICLIQLGFLMQIPIGYEAQIRSRSGLALKNQVFVLNAPGTIDSDYRAEVGVVLMNLGQQIFEVKKHMRIAQMVFAQVLSPEMIVNKVDLTKRTGGFGSTGC